MPRKLHPNELNNLIQLPPHERYDYFIRKTADWEQVWTLKKDTSYVLLGDNKKHELVPLWPHSDFAQLFARGNWSGSVPTEINLDVFLTQWIPGMIKDHRDVAVFPVLTNENKEKGIVVSPQQLLGDFNEELAQYE